MANTPQPNDSQEPRMPGLDDISTEQTGGASAARQASELQTPGEPVSAAPQAVNKAPQTPAAPQPSDDIEERVIRKTPKPQPETAATATNPTGKVIKSNKVIVSNKPTSQASATSPENSRVIVPGVSAGPVREVPRPWYRSNRTWGLVLFIFFLWGVATVVPVGKIPFLRSLAFAMGYSQDEANRLSFLKALLSWKDDSRRERSMAAEGDEISVFNVGGPGMLSGDPSKSKLINVRSVNAALARRGKDGDYLAGSYNAKPGADSEKSPAVRIKNANAAAGTQANKAKNAEVFFGEDSASVQRGKTDAFNSVNMLKKVTNKPVAGVSSGDWMDRLVDKGVREEANLDDVQKSLDPSSSVRTKFGDAKKIGDSRARRDMYYAWLTGRAARRTPQTILKKTLASAGWDGAEMPRTVFSASGYSGVAIKSDDVVADLDSVKKFIELDKKCQEAIEESNRYAPNTSLTIQQIDVLKSTFPETCGDISSSSFDSNLGSIRNSCEQMKTSFDTVKRKCESITLKVDDKCRAETLAVRSQTFKDYCQNKVAACNSLDPDQQADCRKQALGARSDHFCDPSMPNLCFESSQLESEINNTFYDGEGNLNKDYFPAIDWGHSLWVDESITD